MFVAIDWLLYLLKSEENFYSYSSHSRISLWHSFFRFFYCACLDFYAYFRTHTHEHRPTLNCSSSSLLLTTFFLLLCFSIKCCILWLELKAFFKTLFQFAGHSGYASEPEPVAGYDSDVATGYSDKYATLDRRRIKNKESDFTSVTMPRSR
jgi:hypothetical protein